MGTAGDMGYRIGYQDGMSQAREDAYRNKPFNPNPRGKYDDRDHGYRREFGNKSSYKAQYTRWISSWLRGKLSSVIGRHAPATRVRLLRTRYQNPGFPSSDPVILRFSGPPERTAIAAQGPAVTLVENFSLPRSASSPPGIVCVFGKIPHQFKKCRRLSDEQAHIL